MSTGMHTSNSFASIRRPITSDPKVWHSYWQAQGQPWRTMPEIDKERQEQLTARRITATQNENGSCPFQNMKLNRADIEWLLATHEHGRGPVDWSKESDREREGLDLRGTDLRGEDLSGLPLARMRGGLTVRELGNTTLEQRDMAGIHLEGATLIRTHLEGAFLYGAHLEQAAVVEAYVAEAFLQNAHLEKANLYRSDLKRADLSFAHLEEANLIKAHLEGATLSFARLEKALLSEACLERTNLVLAHLEGANLAEANIGKADLQRASLDGETILEDITLGRGKRKFVSLANVRWGGADLTVVDWLSMNMLGDEYEARQQKAFGGQMKDTAERLTEYKTAVQANHQLALVLRGQGMNEEADHFAYRAQLLQRVVWRRRQQWLKYIFSWFLYLLAGYGYRPLRSLFVYLFVIAGFAANYFVVTHALHVQPYPLAWHEALVLSISSFHGRGFFQPVQSLGDPVAMLAAFEAVFGLLIEISFIATFTQRFFGK